MNGISSNIRSKCNDKFTNQEQHDVSKFTGAQKTILDFQNKPT